MIAPKQVYTPPRTEPLPDLRALISRNPEALYIEPRELARLLGCSEVGAEEARRWVAEDGLEVRA